MGAKGTRELIKAMIEATKSLDKDKRKHNHEDEVEVSMIGDEEGSKPRRTELYYMPFP